MSTHLPLTADAVSALEARGCSSDDWSRVRVSAGFDPARVRNVRFAGDVLVGALEGSADLEEGVRLPAGLSDATIVDCEIGDDVLISGVGCLARYRVEDGAVVTGVGSAVTRPGARFGNGVEASPVNEGGGREVTLFAEMSSQYAYLMAMHRHREGLVEGLRRIAEGYARRAASDRGRIGAGARVDQAGRMIDVNVGPAAEVLGAARLCNGTILSEAEAPARVGAGVCAEDFIIAEGAEVEDGVVLHTAFVGQGVRLGKQFSAGNSLFFANCEGFHGEACSIFAGPYTVTHHKSTLLIAGVYSFHNAGSGTNQSNHMYKLGPVHQGVIQRGAKNGSFSYMRWPTVVGPFCVIIGKHLNNFDIGDLPFSYVTEEDGESLCTPAMNMFTVGTVRDGGKWPTRDRREGSVKRDRIRFEVYSPYTVGKMLRGEALLKELYEGTSREVELVRYKGVVIKRLLLRHSARNYADGIDAYLRGRVLERAAEARRAGDAGALGRAVSSGEGTLQRRLDRRGRAADLRGAPAAHRGRRRRRRAGLRRSPGRCLRRGRRRVRGRRVGVGAGRLAGAHRSLDGGADPGLPRRDRGRPPQVHGHLRAQDPGRRREGVRPGRALRIRPRRRRERPRPRLRGRARRLRRQLLRAADAGAARGRLNPADPGPAAGCALQLERTYLGR